MRKRPVRTSKKIGVIIAYINRLMLFGKKAVVYPEYRKKSIKYSGKKASYCLSKQVVNTVPTGL
jgi:hypothetical protein